MAIIIDERRRRQFRNPDKLAYRYGSGRLDQARINASGLTRHDQRSLVVLSLSTGAGATFIVQAARIWVAGGTGLGANDGHIIIQGAVYLPAAQSTTRHHPGKW